MEEARRTCPPGAAPGPDRMKAFAPGKPARAKINTDLVLRPSSLEAAGAWQGGGSCSQGDIPSCRGPGSSPQPRPRAGTWRQVLAVVTCEQPAWGQRRSQAGGSSLQGSVAVSPGRGCESELGPWTPAAIFSRWLLSVPGVWADVWQVQQPRGPRGGHEQRRGPHARPGQARPAVAPAGILPGVRGAGLGCPTTHTGGHASCCWGQAALSQNPCFEEGFRWLLRPPPRLSLGKQE